MYFAIAYEIWPRLTGRDTCRSRRLRLQLWLWFIGMMVMTLPWHWLGLQGQWRRVANFDYARSDHRGVGTLGHRLLRRRPGSARIGAAVRAQPVCAASQRGDRASRARSMRSPCIRRSACRRRSTASASWNVLVLVLMLVAYGYPIAQFVIEPSPAAIVHRVR